VTKAEQASICSVDDGVNHIGQSAGTDFRLKEYNVTFTA
jgi:hypothetical protein